MMLTKVLTRSFKHSRKNTHTVCYTLLHIIEIGLIIDAIKSLSAYSHQHCEFERTLLPRMSKSMHRSRDWK